MLIFCRICSIYHAESGSKLNYNEHGKCLCKVNKTKCFVAQAYKKKKYGHKYMMNNKN
jgi:hypothetical protein